MTVLKGSAKVSVTRLKEMVELSQEDEEKGLDELYREKPELFEKVVVIIPGKDFGLEEGGDWSRDRDSGDYYAGFIFVAFEDGFDLRLDVFIYANTVREYNLFVADFDDDSGILNVEVKDDALNIDNLFRSNDE